MNIEEAIRRMKEVRDKNVHTFVDELTIVLSELEKKDKVIDEMAEILTRYMSTIDNNKPYDLSIGKATRKMTIEEVKEYFTNQVEREGK